MKSIRIGNDISFVWTINRDGRPENFEGKEVRVSLLNYKNEEQEISSIIKGNVVSIDFLGKDQHNLGAYTLVLKENEGKTNMATLDKVEAVKLVEHSYLEGGEDLCPNLKTNVVKIESNFVVSHVINVIDGLSSNSAKDALSANQGRILDGKILQVKKSVPLKVGDLPNDVNYTKKDYVDEANREQNGRIVIEKQRNDTQESQIADILKEIKTFVKQQVGYGLSQENFTSALKKKLELLKNYDDTDLSKKLVALQGRLDILIGSSASEAIDNFNEIEAFLKGFTDKESLTSVLSEYQKSGNIATINGQDITKGGNIEIRGGGEGGSGTFNYEELYNRPSIDGKELTKASTASQLGLQKAEEGKVLSSNDYTSEEKSKLKSLKNYDDEPLKALIATLQTSKLDVTEHNRVKNLIQENLTKKQNTLVSGQNIATINGESLLQGKNIEIKGGGDSYNDSELRGRITNIEQSLNGIKFVKGLPSGPRDANTLYIVTE